MTRRKFSATRQPRESGLGAIDNAYKTNGIAHGYLPTSCD